MNDARTGRLAGVALAVAAALAAIPVGCGGGSAHTAGTGGVGGAGVGGGAGTGVGAGGASGSSGSVGTGGRGGASGLAGTGSGGTTGGAGGATSTCAGLDLRQDGVLDLDLRAVSVTGTVTLNGAPLADQTSSRGQIRFHGTSLLADTSIAFDLGTTGAKTYGLRVPPGTYDIDYVAGSSACASGTTSPWPCGGGSLKRAVAIASDGVLDLDVRVVAVSGAVTLKGAVFPDSTRARGSLTFTGPDGWAATTAAFASTGAVTYRVKVMPGTYDVAYNGDATGCLQDTAPAIPCNSGQLRQQVSLGVDGVLDLDVPAVKVSGAVTLAGAALPTETAARGALTFTAATGGSVATRSLGTTGAGFYAATLLPGRYAIALAANASLCGPSLTPVMPCLGGTLMASTMLSTDGVLDVDMRAVTVSGSVTIAGQPLPTTTGDRGGLRFTRAAGGGGSTYSLGTSGAGTYRVRLLQGTYDVDYNANAGLCSSASAGAPPPLPCTGGPISRGLALMTDGVLDADLKRVQVTGSVTLKGAAMPTATANRGALVFSQAGGGTTSTPSFGTSGNVTYGLSLWPGTYDVQFAANTALCVAGSPAPAVPCVGGPARAGVSLASDGVLDVDVPAVSVSGTVTLNGSALPTETLSRGSITVGRVAAQGGAAVSLALGTTSAPTYAATVMTGSHLFRHAANEALCGAGRALPMVPCASQLVVGCPR